MINPTLIEPEAPLIPSSIIIDGQDGSGKGTVTNIIAERCAKSGANVLKISYPAYNLPWGKFLTHLLKVNDENLSIEDKMLAYALNRLETVPAILGTIEDLQFEGRPINLIFDRFITSNALTIAYYATARSEVNILKPESLASLYNHMLKIDSKFIELLGLDNWSAAIPLLHQEETIRRISGDSTRSGLDMYERVDVQETAAYIYRLMSQLDPRINTFSQFIENENRNMTPFEVADTILPGSNLISSNSSIGQIYELQVDPLEVNKYLVDDLLYQYGSDRLKEIAKDI